jgi:molybdenum cofactor biosynthesis protein A
MGRPVTYLRVSLTRQCNLRCCYCYGSGGPPLTEESQLPSSDLIRLIRAFLTLGISKVRFTGGEPLLRREIVDIVRQTASLEGISLIGLTTNGLTLEPILSELASAGLNCLNVSLDTLDRAVFRKITGVDGFDRVYSAITAAEKSRAFDTIKINTVVMRGVNDGEIRRFARWALNRRIDLRFIEFMPVKGSYWGEGLSVCEDEIRSRIGLDLQEKPAACSNPGPATSYGLPGAPGRISFISAVSRNFCDSCNRLRLTSRGELLGCLFSHKSFDLKRMLFDGANSNEIAGYIRNIIATPGFRRLHEETSLLEGNSFMRKVGG